MTSHLFNVDVGAAIVGLGALVVLQPVGEGLSEAADDVRVRVEIILASVPRAE